MKLKEIHKTFTITRTIKAERVFGPFDMKTAEVCGSGHFMDGIVLISLN